MLGFGGVRLENVSPFCRRESLHIEIEALVLQILRWIRGLYAFEADADRVGRLGCRQLRQQGVRKGRVRAHYGILVCPSPLPLLTLLLEAIRDQEEDRHQHDR